MPLRKLTSAELNATELRAMAHRLILLADQLVEAEAAIHLPPQPRQSTMRPAKDLAATRRRK